MWGKEGKLRGDVCGGVEGIAGDGDGGREITNEVVSVIQDLAYGEDRIAYMHPRVFLRCSILV